MPTTIADEALMYWISGVAIQVLAVACQLVGVIDWPWWIVLAPVEIGCGLFAACIVWLMFTKSNPFQ